MLGVCLTAASAINGLCGSEFLIFILITNTCFVARWFFLSCFIFCLPLHSFCQLSQILLEVDILILFVFLFHLSRVWWTDPAGLLLEIEARRSSCSGQKRTSMEHFVVATGGNGSRKNKIFLVGKSFPITPITTQTTTLANDQLPPPPPSPRAQDISSRAMEARD